MSESRNVDSVQLIPQPHGGALLPPAQPGEIRNPNGRKSLGAYVSECFDVLAKSEPSRNVLRKMIRDEETPANMRIAAVRYLRMQEHPDMADFEDVMDGQKCLKELRSAGVDTAVIKKIKVKRRTVKHGEDEAVEIEREIELHDRSGNDFDRVLDRTDGKPNQVVSGTDGGPVQHILKVRFDDRT